MSKDIKPSQLKPGKRYCFKQPNPTLALSESKKMFFDVTDSSKLGCTIGRISASMLTFHLRIGALKIFKVDK